MPQKKDNPRGPPPAAASRLGRPAACRPRRPVPISSPCPLNAPGPPPHPLGPPPTACLNAPASLTAGRRRRASWSLCNSDRVPPLNTLIRPRPFDCWGGADGFVEALNFNKAPPLNTLIQPRPQPGSWGGPLANRIGGPAEFSINPNCGNYVAQPSACLYVEACLFPQWIRQS